MAKHYYVRLTAAPNEGGTAKVREQEFVNVDAARHTALSTVAACGVRGDDYERMVKYHKVEVVTKEITEVESEITWEFEGEQNG